jgi:hypothetical protein
VQLDSGRGDTPERWRSRASCFGDPSREHSASLAQATPWNRPGNDTLRIAEMNISLRPLEDRDLDTIYQQVTDPESVRMAAFTAEDQTDRRAFLNRMLRLKVSDT